MNANPKALRILCFGDSNTFGQVPGESSDVDGVHFEVEGHQRLGIAVAERIQSLT